MPEVLAIILQGIFYFNALYLLRNLLYKMEQNLLLKYFYMFLEKTIIHGNIKSSIKINFLSSVVLEAWIV